jgi:hypothetical protein
MWSSAAERFRKIEIISLVYDCIYSVCNTLGWSLHCVCNTTYRILNWYSTVCGECMQCTGEMNVTWRGWLTADYLNCSCYAARTHIHTHWCWVIYFLTVYFQLSTVAGRNINTLQCFKYTAAWSACAYLQGGITRPLIGIISDGRHYSNNIYIFCHGPAGIL